ncbi:hypothetical protein FACS1894120_4240 [Clostridia bacterium]|nr:hypothetical protein FACS1894120_4240 [Clostridia bacterium]
MLKIQSVPYGGSATPPTAPELYGYTFSDWSGSYWNVYSDWAIYAQYQKTVQQYTVTFYDYYGNVLKTQSVAYGDSATAPTPPPMAGYKFIGWSGSYSNVYSNLTIQALYQENPAEEQPERSNTIIDNLNVAVSNVSPTIVTQPIVKYKGHVEAIGDLNYKNVAVQPLAYIENIATPSLSNYIGTVGQSRRLEELTIGTDRGTIRAQAHVQGKGDMPPVEDNLVSIGTRGQKLRMESISLKLNGVDGYSLAYRVHQQSGGWSRWATQGQWCGVKGVSKRIEAVEIILIQNTEEQIKSKINSHPIDRLYKEQSLRAGEFLQSANSLYTAIMQSDGNFVIYEGNSYKVDNAMWSSNTCGIYNGLLDFQSDGNIVVYDGSNNVKWSPNIHGKGAVQLIMQDDGNLVAYNENGAVSKNAVWASNTCQTPTNSSKNATIYDLRRVSFLAACAKDAYNARNVGDTLYRDSECWEVVATKKIGTYSYTVYRRAEDQTVVIAFRGTPTPISQNWENWLEHAIYLLVYDNHIQNGYINVDDFKKYLDDSNNKVYITGHSLGGYLTIMGLKKIKDAGYEDRIESAVTFNALGVPKGDNFQTNKLKNFYISNELARVISENASTPLFNAILLSVDEHVRNLFASNLVFPGQSLKYKVVDNAAIDAIAQIDKISNQITKISSSIAKTNSSITKIISEIFYGFPYHTIDWFLEKQRFSILK